MSLIWSAAIALAVALLTMICLPQSAMAQRCPAGADRFQNCYSMDPALRARHEQWAAGGQRSAQWQKRYNCAYRRAKALIRARDPRQMRIMAQRRAGVGHHAYGGQPGGRARVGPLLRREGAMMLRLAHTTIAIALLLALMLIGTIIGARAQQVTQKRPTSIALMDAECRWIFHPPQTSISVALEMPPTLLARADGVIE